MLKAGKEQEEIDALLQKIKELEEALAKEETQRKQVCLTFPGVIVNYSCLVGGRSRQVG
jgi:hypothetical protein